MSFGGVSTFFSCCGLQKGIYDSRAFIRRGVHFQRGAKLSESPFESFVNELLGRSILLEEGI